MFSFFFLGRHILVWGCCCLSCLLFHFLFFILLILIFIFCSSGTLAETPTNIWKYRYSKFEKLGLFSPTGLSLLLLLRTLFFLCLFLCLFVFFLFRFICFLFRLLITLWFLCVLCIPTFTFIHFNTTTRFKRNAWQS